METGPVSLGNLRQNNVEQSLMADGGAVPGLLAPRLSLQPTLGLTLAMNMQSHFPSGEVPKSTAWAHKVRTGDVLAGTIPGST